MTMIRLSILLLLGSIVARAQEDRPIRYFPTDPVSPCSVITPLVNNWVLGKVWECVGASGVNNGTWRLVSQAQTQSAFILDTRQFTFTQTPGQSLSAGVPATVTMNPGPAGVSGADLHHPVYLQAGTGTAESATITGGTCANATISPCTIIFTPANTHTGAWTIGSSTVGCSEAISSLGAAGGTVGIFGTSPTFRDTCWIPANGKVLLGAVTVTAPATAPAFRLAGNYSSLAGQSPQASVITSACTSGRVVLVSNSTLGTAVFNPTIQDLSISVSAAGGSCNGLEAQSSISGIYRHLYVLHTGTFGGSGDGGFFTDTDLAGTGTGAYFDSFENCKFGDDLASIGPSTGWGGNGLHLKSTTNFGITNVNLWNTYTSQNGTGVRTEVVGVGSTVRWVNFVGGGSDSNIGDAVNLSNVQQATFSNFDIEGNGGWGINLGANVTELFLNSGVAFFANTLGNINGSPTQKFWDASDKGGVNRLVITAPPFNRVIDTGANNAIAASLPGIVLLDGLTISVTLAHTLQAGVNTFNLNGAGATAIRSHLNPLNNIATGYAAGGHITLLFDGSTALWMDMSQ